MTLNNLNIYEEDIVLNNKYIIIKLISSGSTVNIFKCIDKETGTEKAV